MKNSLIFFFVCLLYLTACKTKTPAGEVQQPIADTAKFYPLHAFFTEQIQYVDLRNFPIYKITVKDGRKDSSSLSKDQFIEWASVFLERDLSKPSEKILYQEAVFQDLSTGSVTFNYTTHAPNTTVQNIDVLLDESTQQVKRIFIRSLYTRGDTTITEQCNWKANKSFQVNRTFTTTTGFTATELNYINWNDQP